MEIRLAEGMTSKSLTRSNTIDEIQWHDINWHRAHQTVRRLQVRIVKAVKEDNWRKVRNLQRLLTRSFSGAALAVKRVTENKGKRTPGVDNILWNTPSSKSKAINEARSRRTRRIPLKRIYIPKADNAGKRPLSIL